MDPIQGTDFGTFYGLRDLRDKVPSLQPIFVFANALGSYPVLALFALLGLGLLLGRRRFRSAGVFSLAVIIGLLLGECLKLLIGRPRPPEADKLLGPAMSSSFPSVSALLSSLIFVLLAMMLGAMISRRIPRLLANLVCWMLVLLVGTSQLFLGLHFLTDLLAGWSAGIFLALIADSLGGLRN